MGIRHSLALLSFALAGGWLSPASGFGQPLAADSFSLLPRLRRTSWNSPIDTDRPTFTRSTQTVPRGALQYEGGYTFEYFQQPGQTFRAHVFPGTLVSEGASTGSASHRGFRANAFPGSLFRIGLTDRIELRVLWTSAAFNEITGGVARSGYGSTDLGLASKLRLSDQRAWAPETSAIIGLSAPTGALAFTNGQTEFQFNYLYRWELARRWRVVGSTGLRTQRDAGYRYLLFHQSVALEKWLTSSFQGFVEYFGLYFDGYIDDRPENYVQTGFRYRPVNNLQLDWRIGTGMNAAALDYFTGAGLSVRF